ncbi:G-type lectin S-receptor-like serine/threonine-protein kinase At2g19130 [Lolium perenne]|uniref:G-type lectin S-receptor-like serine/threonine-protein kinase At2g19130 n=1 Tax=Lolium perenne TaxID=4522 RepID=UPI0021F5C970|nr:G-type lectin S-receptor-like serine/threonine-protein kinase At2g19130 [Lolium perenne]
MPPHYIQLVLFLLVSLHNTASRCCDATANDVHTLTAGQAVDKLVSRNGKFALGFFTSGSSTTASKSSADNTTTASNWYLGIWFNKIPDFTPVWIANRDEPITHPADLKLQISRDGNLVVLDHIGAAETPVWSTDIINTASKNSSNSTIAVAVLTNNGNLVIRHASDPSQQVWWQSFDYPTDVFLPGSKLGRNKVTGLNRVFISKKNRINPGRGSYCVGVDSRFNQGIILSHCSSSVVYWASGTFSHQNVDPSDTGLTSYNQVDNNQEQYYIYSTPNDESLSIYTLIEISGQIKAHVWNESLQRWHQFYTQPMDPCSVQAACGPFTICTNNNANLLCDCMKGFSVKSPAEWDLDDTTGGCMRNNPLDCTTDKFLPVPGVTLAYNPLHMEVMPDASGCAQACANDCSCTAYSYSTSTGCSIWRAELLNTVASTTAGEILYLRLAAKDYLDILRENKRSVRVVTAASIAGSGTIMMLILVILFIIWRRKHEYGLPSSNTQDCVGIRTFRYSYLRYATKQFSERLGGGGFGSVYKGLLSDSDITIAVKRLDGARQGEKQFRAEVSSIGLIQHINLVKLIGFCCESDKRLLVYEHMSNGSLDVHLFNSKDIGLDWSTRYHIATGVARGLSYLHEGCRECIIHCDIKPENILLDATFVPKVADFGMATIVGRDFSRVLTTFRGTVGYLAPEWISGEAITQKVDVYSFGMVLLEIVSGRRNLPKADTSDNYQTSYFPMQAITMLHGGDMNSLVDPLLCGEFNLEEAIRVCKVAFWCIQDSEFDRPTMGEVVRALEGLQELDMPPMPRQLAAITKC